MNFGRDCENWAADYAGHVLAWRVVDRNVHFRHGELDLVCHDGQCWRFIEVKGRHSDEYGTGLELVSPAKLRRLKRCVAQWMQRAGWGPWRLELWCVVERSDRRSLERWDLVTAGCCKDSDYR